MDNQPYYNFWQKIHKSADEKRFPLRVMFELTYKCNFKCGHCYVPQKHKERKSELKTEEVFDILDQLKSIGCFYLGFTGGEPFTRKDIIPILKYAKKCGFELIIYTNGSLIDEKTASELKNLQLNKVDITLPAMTSEACDSITGVPGSRDKIYTAVELLYDKKVKLGFKTCLLKENELEIDKIKDFADSLGAFHRLSGALLPRLDGSQQPYEYEGKLKDKPQLAQKARLDCSLENISNEKAEVKKLFECGVGRSQAAITAFGELKMCLMIDYPRFSILDKENKLQAPGCKPQAVRSKGLKGAWQRLKLLVDDIKPDKNYLCDKCELEAYCRWCPAKAWLSTGTFTSCDLQSRRKAEQLFQETSQSAFKKEEAYGKN